MGKTADGKSPFEKLYDRNPNTVKSNWGDKVKSVSVVDPGVNFSTSYFKEEINSAVPLSQRTKGSELERKFKKKAGKVKKESTHAITVLPKHSKKEVVYSKRDVARAEPGKKSRQSPHQDKEERAGPSSRWVTMEQSSLDKTYVAPEEDVSMPTPYYGGSRVGRWAGARRKSGKRKSAPEVVEAEKEEMAVPQDMRANLEKQNPEQATMPPAKWRLWRPRWHGYSTKEKRDEHDRRNDTESTWLCKWTKKR